MRAVFIFISLLFVFISFVSANCDIVPLTEQVILEKMIWGLPELSNFTFGGVVEYCGDYEGLDLRYISLMDDHQHSEYYLRNYNFSDNAEEYFNWLPTHAQFLWNLSINNVNGNNIYEGFSGEQKYFFWISGNNILQGWNGDDIGTIVDNPLFDFLTLKYLEKYPSTFTVCTDTDGGLNYPVLGIVSIGNLSHTDFCINSNLLNEYYCPSNTSMDAVNYSCSYGCLDGKCKSKPLCKPIFKLLLPKWCTEVAPAEMPGTNAQVVRDVGIKSDCSFFKRIFNPSAC